MSEKSLKMEHSQAFAPLEEPGAAPPRAAGAVRDGKNERGSSRRGGWTYNRQRTRRAKSKSWPR